MDQFSPLIAHPSFLADFSSSVSTGSPRNSRRSWEENIQALSRDLQVICGSPSSPTPTTVLGNVDRGQQGSPSFAGSKRTPSIAHSPSHSNLRQILPATMRSNARPRTFRRAESQDPSTFFANTRRLLVRHEETEAKLKQRLSAICQLTPEEIFSRGTYILCPTRPDVGIIRGLRMKPGVLFKIDLGECRSMDDIFVLVVEDRLLRICSSATAPHRIFEQCSVIEELAIPNEMPVNSLVCSIVDNRWFYVQECPGRLKKGEFVTTSCRFHPFVREEETVSEMEIFLRIPPEFDVDDVTVKTVDDNVVITGLKRQSSPLGFTLGSDWSAGSASLMTSSLSPPIEGRTMGLPYFHLVMSLPHNTYSRSVSARITQHHQLIITGKLGPTSRRYTL